MLLNFFANEIIFILNKLIRKSINTFNQQLIIKVLVNKDDCFKSWRQQQQQQRLKQHCHV